MNFIRTISKLHIEFVGYEKLENIVVQSIRWNKPKDPHRLIAVSKTKLETNARLKFTVFLRTDQVCFIIEKYERSFRS